LKINGLLQTRWTSVDYDTAAAVPAGVTAGNTEWGFDNARSWVHFSGTIAGDYSYDIRHDLNNATNNGGSWENGSMNLSDDWALTMGSMKMATSREALIGDQNQLALDRNTAFTVGQGAQLAYTGDDLRVMMQLFNNTDATVSAAPASNNSSYSANIRAEFMVEGSGWGQFDEFTSADGGAVGTLIGLSYNTNDNGDSVPNPGVINNTDGMDTWNIDAQMQFGGSNLYVSYNSFSDSNTAGAADTDVNSLQVITVSSLIANGNSTADTSIAMAQLQQHLTETLCQLV
jgi:hypothetical protein